MELLSKLTPAETYLIKENLKARFKDYLKLTLADLLLKKVLRIEARADPDKALEEADKYITVGQLFKAYTPKPHEEVFLSPFLLSSDLEILFRDFIRTTHQNSRGFRHFVISLVMKGNGLLTYFKQGFWFKLLGTTKLNAEGIPLKTKLDEELSKLEKVLPEYMVNDKEKAFEIIREIHGNIYLVAGLDPEILKEIEAELNKQLNTGEDYYYDSYWLWYGADADEFDSAFDDSADGSGDGGDGDAGCSGCGGCGGD